MKILLVAFCVAAVAALSEINHLIQTDSEGRTVKMDITHDEEEMLLISIIGDMSAYEKGVRTVNLHDYKMGYGVFKNIDRKRCVLVKPLRPMQPAWKYRQGHTNEVQYHQIRVQDDPLTSDQVLNIAGPNIAQFCKDYTVVYGNTTMINEIKRDASFTSAVKEVYGCALDVCVAMQQSQ